MAKAHRSEREDAAVARLTSLVFAFLNAANNGGRALDTAWIRRNVEGYQGRSEQAFSKMLHRDINTLSRAGVPLEALPNRERDSTSYRLQAQQYELPNLQVTPEEAAVLGLAGQIGQHTELGAFARSGWTKLAASGVERDLSPTAAFKALATKHGYNDLSSLHAQMLTDILTIIRRGLRMTFSYSPTPTSTPQRRTMDPWAIVTVDERLYLVGHDIDRDSPRSFRIQRVSQVRALREVKATHPQPEESLQTLVARSLRQRQVLVDAVLAIEPGHALELQAVGTRREDGLFELQQIGRDHLVRTAAGFAPHVVVHEPAEVRAEVIALLRKAAADNADYEK